MTPERRLQILTHLRTIDDPRELAGFRWGLQVQGELADPDVAGAVALREAEIKMNKI